MKMDVRKKKMLTLLACVFVFFLLPDLLLNRYMKKKSTPELISSDSRIVLSEMPQTELTQTEKDFAQKVFDIPQLHDAVADPKSKGVTIEPEEARGILAEILPEDAQMNEMMAYPSLVLANYRKDGCDIVIGYADTDKDGAVDQVQKAAALKPDDPDEKPDEMILYEHLYHTDTGESEYKKSSLG